MIYNHDEEVYDYQSPKGKQLDIGMHTHSYNDEIRGAISEVTDTHVTIEMLYGVTITLTRFSFDNGYLIKVLKNTAEVH